MNTESDSELLTDHDIEQTIWTLENSTDDIDQKAIAIIAMFKTKADIGWSIVGEATQRLTTLGNAIEMVLDNPGQQELWLDDLKRAVAMLSNPMSHQRTN